jgi:hypothetical protein
MSLPFTLTLMVSFAGYVDFKLVKTTLYPSCAEPVTDVKLPVTKELSFETTSNLGSYIVFVSLEKNFNTP